jgi:hypothetical protein
MVKAVQNKKFKIGSFIIISLLMSNVLTAGQTFHMSNENYETYMKSLQFKITNRP